MEDDIPGEETGQRLEPPPALKWLAAGAGIETARGPNVEGKPGGWEWECGSIEPLEREGSSIAREGGGRGGRGVALREEWRCERKGLKVLVRLQSSASSQPQLGNSRASSQPQLLT